MPHNIYCATTQINPSSKPEMWQMILWLWIMIYRLQLIWYTSKFNLKIYFLCVQRKYIQFHIIKFKMPKFHLLIWLETSSKNWLKAQHCQHLFPIKSVHLVFLHPPPLAYGLYTCENVDNYGWPIIKTSYNRRMTCMLQIACLLPKYQFLLCGVHPIYLPTA